MPASVQYNPRSDYAGSGHGCSAMLSCCWRRYLEQSGCLGMCINMCKACAQPLMLL